MMTLTAGDTAVVLPDPGEVTRDRTTLHLLSHQPFEPLGGHRQPALRLDVGAKALAQQWLALLPRAELADRLDKRLHVTRRHEHLGLESTQLLRDASDAARDRRDAGSQRL